MPRWQRSLLPAVLGAGPDVTEADRRKLPRTARDWLVDFAIFCLAGRGRAGRADPEPQDGRRTAGDGRHRPRDDRAARALGPPPPSVHRGSRCLAASALSGLAGGAAVAAVFTVAIHCPPRRTAQVAALSVAASAIYASIYRSDRAFDWTDMLVGVLASAVAIGFGLLVRARRELVFSLHDRSRRLQAEQDLRVREARHAERTRIAREMHDVLAHRISLLSVHAGALEFNPAASPEEIARAAGVIRVSARAAQEDLREVIGVLRDDAEEPAVRPPQPTLVDVPELVAESRRAGMEVDCRNTWMARHRHSLGEPSIASCRRRSRTPASTHPGSG
jgi:hypothetical protein